MNDSTRTLSAFETLRAEDEPWLAECYVPPPDFSVMASWRSAVIFGEPGTGNTALRLALEGRVWAPGQRPHVLLARWQLAPWFTTAATGTVLVQQQYRMALDAVARALIEHLGRWPEGWGDAPTWAHETLAWFIHHYFHGDLMHYVGMLQEEGTADGCALLQALITAPVKNVLYPEAAPTLVMSELIRALERLGLQGVWVFVSDLEPWLQADGHALARTMHAFLTTLALFEHPRFAYKMLLPAALEPRLGSAGGIVRHRAEVFSLRLQWQTDILQAITERRLAWAFERAEFTFQDLCDLPNLAQWLQRCGGYSPRGWLQFIRPFVSAYLQAVQTSRQWQPLPKKVCRDVQRQHAPRLFLDETTGQITVGLRTIENLPIGLYALLCHLYRKRGQICSWRELYDVYVKAYPDSVPDPDVKRAEYAGMLDTALWRLRQEIEPDPRQHLLIVTVKQRGVRLDHAW